MEGVAMLAGYAMASALSAERPWPQWRARPRRGHRRRSNSLALACLRRTPALGRSVPAQGARPMP